MGVYYSRDGLNRTTALHAGHGDILTWAGGVKATPEEDKRAAMLAGHRVGMNLAYAFVDPALATPGTQIPLDLYGEIVGTEVIDPSPYDPSYALMRG